MCVCVCVLPDSFASPLLPVFTLAGVKDATVFLWALNSPQIPLSPSDPTSDLAFLHIVDSCCLPVSYVGVSCSSLCVTTLFGYSSRLFWSRHGWIALTCIHSFTANHLHLQTNDCAWVALEVQEPSPGTIKLTLFACRSSWNASPLKFLPCVGSTGPGTLLGNLLFQLPAAVETGRSTEEENSCNKGLTQNFSAPKGHVTYGNLTIVRWLSLWP